jgi:hypothetical protein
MASLQNSLSLPSVPPHNLLYDSITIILSAKPPLHTDSYFGHRVRGNFTFCLDSSAKVTVSWLFLPNSHTALGPDFGHTYAPNFPFLCDLLQGLLPIPFHTQYRLKFVQGQVRPDLSIWHSMAPQPWCVRFLPFLPLFLSVPHPLTLWPFGPGESGPWLCRLEPSVYCSRFVFLSFVSFLQGTP